MDERYRETLKIWDQLSKRHQDSSNLDIFNESYEELRGYTTRGRNVYVGLNINL